MRWRPSCSCKSPRVRAIGVLASTACDGFVAATADAAERVGKGALARQGIHPRRTHDMNMLAHQIDNLLNNEEQTNEQDQAYLRRLPSRLRALNSDTRHDHKSDYPDVPVSAAECVRAGRRLIHRMLALWSDEIKQDRCRPTRGQWRRRGRHGCATTSTRPSTKKTEPRPSERRGLLLRR